MTDRTCTRCKVSKALGDFGIHRQTKDGVSLWCKACNRASALAYRNRNIEVVRAKDRDRVANAPIEWKRAKHKSWRDRNREHVRDYARRQARRYYAANPTKFRAQHKAHRLAHLTEMLERSRAAHRHRVANLHDSYVRFLLSGGNSSLAQRLPNSLVAAKREQIKLRRLSKELIDG